MLVVANFVENQDNPRPTPCHSSSRHPGWRRPEMPYRPSRAAAAIHRCRRRYVSCLGRSCRSCRVHRPSQSPLRRAMVVKIVVMAGAALVVTSCSSSGARARRRHPKPIRTLNDTTMCSRAHMHTHTHHSRTHAHRHDMYACVLVCGKWARFRATPARPGGRAGARWLLRLVQNARSV